MAVLGIILDEDQLPSFRGRWVVLLVITNNLLGKGEILEQFFFFFLLNSPNTRKLLWKEELLDML